MLKNFERDVKKALDFKTEEEIFEEIQLRLTHESVL
jgi:hypothetical protein